MSESKGRPPSFLGTGWAFPPSFGAGGAEVEMVSGVDDVHQALRVLFATRWGERPMAESFGCSLDDHVFGEVDQALINSMRSAVRNAVLEHETRIRLHDVAVTTDARTDGVLRIALDYSVLVSNSRFNMVFPFYLTEASLAAR